MKYTRYSRSMLCTPALATERFAKAHLSGADICTVDLEDSIPLAAKNEARQRAPKFFTAPATGSTSRHAIRINALTTPDGMRDVLALQEFPVKPAIVVVPKVESAREIEILEKALGQSCPDLEYFAIVETARGVDNVAAIAGSSRRLRGLIFGAADYSFDVGTKLSWESLVPARARVVNSARAAGIEAMDSPTFEVSDIAAATREALLAHDLGFSGKFAIHPRQLSVIHEVFSPDPVTLDQARKIVAAGEKGHFEIAVVDGFMMGTPFFEAARSLVEEFGT
jgi:citrate lyase beta subunit